MHPVQCCCWHFSKHNKTLDKTSAIRLKKMYKCRTNRFRLRCTWFGKGAKLNMNTNYRVSRNCVEISIRFFKFYVYMLVLPTFEWIVYARYLSIDSKTFNWRIIRISILFYVTTKLFSISSACDCIYIIITTNDPFFFSISRTFSTKTTKLTQPAKKQFSYDIYVCVYLPHSKPSQSICLRWFIFDVI